MSRAWMPLYVADYRADTGHLSRELHGSYLLLIMHYWQTGGLPDDDEQLARIACCTPAEWKRSRPVIVKFFGDSWKHRRIEQELAKAAEISSKRSGAAQEMHRKRAANAHASAEQMHTQPQSPLQPPSPKNNSLVEGGGKSGWTPPDHMAFSKRKGRLYVKTGTPEWVAYAEDFREAHGVDPEPNEHGGRWFNHLGEKRAS